MSLPLSPESRLMLDNASPSPYEGAVVPPIFQSSLFTFNSWEALDEAYDDRINRYIYSRGKNPTVVATEQKLALLAGGEKAQLFPSGMAAITASILHSVKAGDHVIAVNNLYGPAAVLLQRYLRQKINLATTFVSGESLTDFENALQPNTRLIYLESPSSAVFSLQNIAEVARWARAHQLTTIIDNTWATPLYQRPLELGVDLEIHSATKYLGGHSDIVAGVVIGKAVDIDSIFLNEYELLGAKMAPQEAWLLLRGLRTLPVRMRQHQENAMRISRFLEQHSLVERVRYPGLPSFPQYDLGRQQMSGYSGLMSFRLATEEISRIRTFVNALQLFQLGVSWGGYESLVYAPAISYAKEMSPEQIQAAGISLADIRISVGLESAEDLIADLEGALGQL